MAGEEGREKRGEKVDETLKLAIWAKCPWALDELVVLYLIPPGKWLLWYEIGYYGPRKDSMLFDCTTVRRYAGEYEYEISFWEVLTGCGSEAPWFASWQTSKTSRRLLRVTLFPSYLEQWEHLILQPESKNNIVLVLPFKFLSTMSEAVRYSDWRPSQMSKISCYVK